MVQKTKTTEKAPRRPRGRPRGYDPQSALDRAQEAFWDTGYTGTTLDDLSALTGMNRPSLYAAFGDKRVMYLRTLERYREMGRTLMKEELTAPRPLDEALRGVFARAISIYLSGRRGARGCYLIGTAATESVRDAKIRATLAFGLHELDDLLEERLRRARASGELKSQLEPGALARVICGVMNSLALRARAGESEDCLRDTAEAAVRLVCGS